MPTTRTRGGHKIRRTGLASEGPYAGGGYCVALVQFGTTADAELLSAYVDHYLSRPDLDYDQPTVLGTLLYLDEVLGSERASRFIAPGGPGTSGSKSGPSQPSTRKTAGRTSSSFVSSPTRPLRPCLRWAAGGG
ncbi:DUF6000 family protein [Streptomyces mauvecolor]